jgi:outer membrane protein W
LNFLNFTRRFDFYSSKDTSKEKGELRSTAGVSVGIINAGVGNIDGRDNQGIHTEELSTSENQFFLGLGVKLSRKLALGLNAKFYYYKLYEDVSSSGVGLDIGALYSLNEEWNISLVIADLNSKYDWETNSIYGQDGTSTKDKFPLLKKIGVSYHNEGSDVIAAAEFENSNAGTNIIKVGIEYNIYENLFVRGGVDKFNLSNTDAPAKPALGFSYYENFGSLVIGVDYAFMIEQYSPHDRHIVGVNVNF